MAKKSKKKTKKTKKSGVGGKLSEGQSDWEESEARSLGAPLPDDTYEGVIENTIIEESRNGRLQVRWDLLVTAGNCEGRQVRKYSGLETKDNMDWLKGDLETLGLEAPAEMSDLGEVLEEACSMAISFQVRSKDEFTNIDFIEPLEEGSGDDNDNDNDDGDDYTKAGIKKMKKSELKDLAEENDLDPDDYDNTAELRDAIIEELEL